MLSKEKARLEVSIKKESLDLITNFSKALGMKKSEFIEEVCLAFISDVCKKSKERRKNKKEAK